MEDLNQVKDLYGNINNTGRFIAGRLIKKLTAVASPQ